MPEGSLLWVLVGGVLLVLLAGVAVRVVPEHQRVVVTRFGRVVRVAGPGLTVRVPGLEDVTTVSLRPHERQVVVSATTRDGIHVQLLVRVVCRVTEPSRSVAAALDAFEATVDVLESRLHSGVGQSDIGSVLPLRASLEADLPAAVNEVTATWGVEVLDLKLLDVGARLSGDLLRGLQRPDASI